jgi:hypothetical protein
VRTQPKRYAQQVNLALGNPTPAGLPASQARELSLALAELLVRAVPGESAVATATWGGQDASEIDS